MPLLDIVRDAAIQAGLSPPSVAASSTDQTTVELVHFANLALRELRAWHDWSALSIAATITGDGTTTEWTPPADFDRMSKGQAIQKSNGTFFRLYGPLNAVQRTDWRARDVVQTNEVFWFRGGKIVISPALAAGIPALYDYQSKNAVRPTPGSDKAKFTLDTDTALIDEDLVALCLLWMHKRSKGLDYAQEYEGYRQRAQLIAGRDGSLQPVAAGPVRDDLPDVFTPDTITVT